MSIVFLNRHLAQKKVVPLLSNEKILSGQGHIVNNLCLYNFYYYFILNCIKIYKKKKKKNAGVWTLRNIAERKLKVNIYITLRAKGQKVIVVTWNWWLMDWHELWVAGSGLIVRALLPGFMFWYIPLPLLHSKITIIIVFIPLSPSQWMTFRKIFISTPVL